MRHPRRATSGPGDPPVPAENDPEPISSKRGIQDFYDDPAVVDSYIAVRISEPFNTVLHERQVGFLNQVIGGRQPRRMLGIAVGPGRLSPQGGAASAEAGPPYLQGLRRALAARRAGRGARGRRPRPATGRGRHAPLHVAAAAESAALLPPRLAGPAPDPRARVEPGPEPVHLDGALPGGGLSAPASPPTDRALPSTWCWCSRSWRGTSGRRCSADTR